MKRWLKKIGMILVALLLAIQFYQPARNTDKGIASSIKLDSSYNIPVSVKNILQKSCYDCHSNNTRYPWYANLQPIRYFLDGHINEAKKELNFDEWGTYSNRKQASKLDIIIKQVENKQMPIASYTLIHRDASLSEAERKDLISWINDLKIKDE